MKKRTSRIVFHKALRNGFVIVLYSLVVAGNVLMKHDIVSAKESFMENRFVPDHLTILLIVCLFFLIMLGISAMIIWKVKKASEDKLREASVELRHITNSIHACFANLILEPGYPIIYASNGFYDLVGYDKNEIKRLFNNDFTALAVAEDLDKFTSFTEGFVSGEYVQKEVRLVTKSGKIIWILINGNYIQDKEKKKSTLSAVIIDISESRLMQEKLLLEEERYRVATEISNDILFEYDVENDKMIFANKYKELYGSEPVIYRFSEVLKEDKFIIHDEDTGVFSEYLRALSSGKEMVESEFRLRDVKGEYVWCHTRGKTLYGDKKRPTRVIGKIVNIDLHKKELQTLENKAKRDPLTGVYNKSTTKDLIDHYIQQHSEAKHIFMIVDIDDFKSINDRYGHLQGDKVLSFVISQVKMIFSAGEIIGRIGGDEFAVFIGNITSREIIASKADLLRRTLQTVYLEDAYQISVSGSIGVSMYPSDGLNYNQLLDCADKALYYVKDCGKDGYKLFT